MMNNLSKTVIALVSCASVLCVTAPAVAVVAITIGDHDTSWPTDVAQACVNSDQNKCATFDPTGGGVSSGLGLSDGRVVGQSFNVTSPTYIASLFVESRSYKAGQYTLRLHEVADTTISGNNDPMLGAVLAEGVGFTVAAADSTERVVRYDLDTPIALSPQAGDAGYAIAFSDAVGLIPHTHPTINSFPLISGSLFYVNVNSTQQSLAFAFATPEPASLTLLGLGGLLMLRRRKNA